MLEEISTTSYADGITLMADSDEELSAFWWRWNRREKRLAYNSTFKKLRSWYLVLSLHGKQRENVETVSDFIFLGSKITVDDDCSHKIRRRFAPWKNSYDKSQQCIKKQRHHFANKGPYSQSYGFSNSHVWMWELDHKQKWTLKNWYFWTVVPETTLNSESLWQQEDRTSQS